MQFAYAEGKDGCNRHSDIIARLPRALSPSWHRPTAACRAL